MTDQERLRQALRLLLDEARSDQHRGDRSNRECPPMEAAIDLALSVLRDTRPSAAAKEAARA